MRMRVWLPAFSTAALALLGLGAGVSHAGSFFGPDCYGANYAYEYPNRAHNYFGCGPGTQCTARHPIFKHRWFHKKQDAPAAGMTPGGMPVNAPPFEYATAPAMPAPITSLPVHTVSAPTAPVPASPAVSSRLVPVPSAMPVGPSTPEPPTVNPSSKPPF